MGGAGERVVGKDADEDVRVPIADEDVRAPPNADGDVRAPNADGDVRAPPRLVVEAAGHEGEFGVIRAFVAPAVWLLGA